MSYRSEYCRYFSSSISGVVFADQERGRHTEYATYICQTMRKNRLALLQNPYLRFLDPEGGTRPLNRTEKRPVSLGFVLTSQ